MENLNIRLYKDGDDLIVVYKNGAKDIEEISKKILSPLNSQEISVKEIPNLVPVPEKEEKPVTVKEAEEKYENIYPAFTEEENDEVIPEETPKKEKINPEEILEKEKFEGFIKLLSCLVNNDVAEEDKASIVSSVKGYYAANRDNIRDAKRVIKHEELKKIIHISYNLFKESIDFEIKKKSFIDIEMALTTMTQYDVRGLYWNTVVRDIDEIVKKL